MPGTHLSLPERYQIERGLAEGLAHAQIAARLGRHADTIVREVARRSGPYSAERAHEAARWRRSLSAANHPTKSARQWRQVERQLFRGHSPEQIVLARRRGHATAFSIQAIYDHIERDQFQGGTLYRYRRKPPRARARKDGRQKSWAHQARQFHTRPSGAACRKRVGHLELDTMEGKKRDGVRVLVGVERLSGSVMLQRLSRADAKTTVRAIKRMFARHAYVPIKTVTTDRGMEFAGLPADMPQQHYVCDPYRPTQRGLCENTIGLIRQYLPKYQSLANTTQQKLDQIADLLNNRPRKRLNGRTPKQVLSRRINAAATRS